MKITKLKLQTENCLPIFHKYINFIATIWNSDTGILVTMNVKHTISGKCSLFQALSLSVILDKRKGKHTHTHIYARLQN